MKSLIAFALTTLFTAHAHADLNIGVYSGTNADGDPCSFVVNQVGFLGPKHPFNERIEITVQNENFTVSHPVSMDRSTGKLSHDSRTLQGAKGRGLHSLAVFMTVEHSSTQDGPTEITFVRDHRQSTQPMSTWTCGSLRYEGTKFAGRSIRTLVRR